EELEQEAQRSAPNLAHFKLKHIVCVCLYAYLCRSLCREAPFQHVRLSRQRAQNQEKEELLELYRCQIEETKLRHRKARVKFGKELQQLMEQHKNLYSAFSPARLPGEVAAAENAAAELLKAGKCVHSHTLTHTHTHTHTQSLNSTNIFLSMLRKAKDVPTRSASRGPG
uniref:Uncharacterized protein n=1 Tax=Denticeps clupeoides TaxID=299321 RepID=A0AAY4BE28_9TELE